MAGPSPLWLLAVLIAAGAGVVVRMGRCMAPAVWWGPWSWGGSFGEFGSGLAGVPGPELAGDVGSVAASVLRGCVECFDEVGGGAADSGEWRSVGCVGHGSIMPGWLTTVQRCAVMLVDNHPTSATGDTMAGAQTILDRMILEAGCTHPARTETDHNGDPACPPCITEWAQLPDQR